jgi:hypothetical protein
VCVRALFRACAATASTCVARVSSGHRERATQQTSVLMVPCILDEKLLEGVSDTLEVLQGEATSVALVSGAVRRNSAAVNGCREKTTGESKGKAHRRDLLIGAQVGDAHSAHHAPCGSPSARTLRPSVIDHRYHVACSRFSVALVRLARACTHTHMQNSHKRASTKTHTRAHTQAGMLHTSEAPTSGTNS